MCCNKSNIHLYVVILTFLSVDGHTTCAKHKQVKENISKAANTQPSTQTLQVAQTTMETVSRCHQKVTNTSTVRHACCCHGPWSY